MAGRITIAHHTFEALQQPPTGEQTVSFTAGGQMITRQNGTIASPYGIYWLKYEFDYSDLAVPLATLTVSVDNTLPAGWLPVFTFIKHSVAFSGTGITAVTTELGFTAQSSFRSLASSDIYRAAADDKGTFQALSSSDYVPDIDTAVPLQARFTTTGGNLDALTAGAAVAWIGFTVFPW